MAAGQSLDFGNANYERVPIPHEISDHDLVFYNYMVTVEFTDNSPVPNAMDRKASVVALSAASTFQATRAVMDSTFSSMFPDLNIVRALASPNFRNVLAFLCTKQDAFEYFRSGPMYRPVTLDGCWKFDLLTMAMEPAIVTLPLREKLTYGQLIRWLDVPQAFSQSNPLYRTLIYIAFKACIYQQLPKMAPQ